MKKILLALLTVFAFAFPTFAATYPEKAVQLVVPFPPGGGSDISARVAVEFVNRLLPQPLVVSNISGGTGSVGAKHVLRAKPDGYTLFWEHQTMSVQTATKVVDHSFKDFDIVGGAVRSTFILVANKKLPVKTATDLLDYMKATPGKVRWPMSFGAMSHFGFLYVANGYKGGELVPGIVANAGDKDRIVAIIGDHADASCVAISAAAPYIASGDVLALGVLSEERMAMLPDVPTLREQGIDSVYNQLFTVFAPKGLPDDIKATIQKAFKDGLSTPEAKKAFANLYCVPDVISPEETAALWAKQEAFNESLVKKYNLSK
ncbi:MAG: tripartite tricarboxylate transporter substrate binding protein [Desulfovibrio sp.]|jgi:tripartite-type tricarboxylate transporter receptor subunit TctC|nr:tripartite tricarboxylate transporter substrate binding protein [Desulfovibrio sp.]